ncbi:MAG TPA: cytochrome c oxidase assembly protein [Burkholderiaceae bacterium]
MALALRRLSSAAVLLPGAAVPAGAHGPVFDMAPPAVLEVPLWLWICLATSLVLYALGLLALWRRAGTGHGIARWRAACFAAGWLALLLALASPLDSWSARLFSAHMLQHELLMVVAAPLLVLGRPLAVWTFALTPRMRRACGGALRAAAWRGTWRLITRPLTAWALHAVALWAWHAPAAFDAALHDEALHELQHATFLASALLFWWTVLGVRHAAPGIPLLSVFTTMIHSGALGALLALSPWIWYLPYAASAFALGWDPLQDQQLGGLVMWAPAGAAYFASGLLLAAQLLRPSRVVGPAS